MVHYLHYEQVIPAPREKVWEYFCTPHNLNKITPPDMNFEICSGGDVTMYPGQLIEYRVEFVKGVRLPWLTEIAHVRDGIYFVDEQRMGSYRFWYHEHHFEDHDAGTKMTDHVTYMVPFGILGDILNRFWISDRLKHIFNFRRKKIVELFGESL